MLAWQRLETFHGRSKFGTWLHRIAVNVVLGRRRKSASYERRLTLVEPAEPGSTPEPDEIEALEQAIRRLPERTREAFVLQKVYGYTHEETSDMLDIAVGNCKAQVHRAMRLLYETLGGEQAFSDTQDAVNRRGQERS